MLNKTKYAFTLVELIVVITILAILGTIAFISMQGYSKSTRDSVRISDMSKIKSTLEFFHIDSGKYPDPTEGYEVTFSGSEVWTQGIFGDKTFSNVKRLDKIPLDPLTNNKYTYSRLNTKQEFEIAGVVETNDIAYNSEVFAEGELSLNAIVTGTYNGKMAKVYTGSTTYVFAVPTIVGALDTTLDNIYTNNAFVYSGYENLSSIYDGTKYENEGEGGTLSLVNNDPSTYILFSGDISDLSNPDNASDRIALLQNLQNAYTGSIIANNGLSEIMTITDFSETNSDVTNLAGIVVNDTLGTNISVKTVTTTTTTSTGSEDSGGSVGECVFDTSTYDNCTFGS